MGHDFGHACDVCDVVLISLQRREKEDELLWRQSWKICHKKQYFSNPRSRRNGPLDKWCFLIVLEYVFQGFTVEKDRLTFSNFY